jgi:UDP-N-acetyl-D-mannosaminuronic acid dehydrogenase
MRDTVGALDLCVVGGCGRVGLPLALTFTQRGLRVGIYDIDTDAIATVSAGKLPFIEAGAQELLSEALSGDRLELSADPSIIKRSSVVVLVVGTPIDEFLNPSLSGFDRVIDELALWVAEGTLIVLRSTVFPGVTEWVSRRLDERGCQVDVVFCPERIAEGHAIEELTTLPQIIGADTESAQRRAEDLFAVLGVTTVATTPKEAELAKLFTNAWRYLKFAVANQFFTIARGAKVDYGRILHAIRHDYPRAQDLPGPGFSAGPCLLKDTMQLSSFTSNQFVLGHAAMLVNEGLPELVVHELQNEVTLQDTTVAILGMAFKAESDDTRASLSYKLKKRLLYAGARVLCTDPHVDGPDIVDLDTALADADIVIIAAPHEAYRDLDFGERRVVDIWAFTSPDIRI